MNIAVQTLRAIDEAIASDDGNAYRGHLQTVLPHMTDAYRQENRYRSHLGASIIGNECARQVAYGWRWGLNRPPRGRKAESAVQGHSRLMRLFNRGHLEEARFIALLLTIGVQVYQQDDKGNQLRISEFGGHFGGSCDSVLVGVPDLPPGVPCLGEYKTHNQKSFDSLTKEGVERAKPEHFVQMQMYMGGLGLLYALYLAVNKNDDALHAEIVQAIPSCYEHFKDRAARIIFEPKLPPRIRSASPSFHICKNLCDYRDLCFHTVAPAVNCRTCAFSIPEKDGTWLCMHHGHILSKEDQIAGCADYRVDEELR